MNNFVWVFPLTVLFVFSFHLSEGLECYHCYIDRGVAFGGDQDSKFVRCNESNLTLSNTWVCPQTNAQCVYQDIEFESTHLKQTWRTCSNGVGDPCDPSKMPPGMKLTKCMACNTDRCNLYPSEKNDVFTFNINANINLYVRQ